MTETQPSKAAPFKQIIGQNKHTSPLTSGGETAVGKTVRSSSRLDHALNQIVYDNLPRITLGGALLHFLLACSYPFIISPAVASTMIVIAAAIVLGLGLLWLPLRRGALPASWAHPVLTLIVLLSLVNVLAYLYLSAEMRQTVLLLFIVVGASQFYLSARWFTAVLLTTLLGWSVVAGQMSGSATFFGAVLLLATAAAAIMFIMRKQALQRYESLRWRDQQHKQQLAQRASRLETSLAVGQRIVSILDLDALLAEMVTLIQEQYGFDYAGVFLLDESGTLLQMRAGTGSDGQQLCAQNTTLPVNEQSLVGWVAVHGRFLHVPDVRREPRYTALKPHRPICAELDLPLRMGHKMLGVLTLQSEQEQGFDDNDIPFLQLLSTQVAIAITNASLYQREKSARRLAETLQDTGRALTGTLEWNAVIDLILQRLEEIVSYDRASVLVQNGRLLEMVAARGFPSNSQPLSIQISLENESIFRQIYETKRPLAIEDVQERTDWRQFDALPAARAWLGVPLDHAGSVIGMLSLTRETAQPYSEDEISLAAAFAGQAAIAIKNARAYEQTTRFNQQLEYEVRQRTEAIRKAYAELEQLNLSKSDFISIVSHELRTPVTILDGYSQMLQQDQAIQDNPVHASLVDGIQSGARRLEEIINSMLDVVKIDNQELRLYPAPVALAALVRMVGDDFARPLAQRQLHLVIDPSLRSLPVVHADPDLLQKVFGHLLTNAIKYTPDGGTITITGRQWQSPPRDDLPADAVEIIVADTGIGIDPADAELIFTKFYQTGKVSLHSSSKTQFKGGGPGLGLAISRGIIEAHRGAIWAESAGHDEMEYPGSEFHVVLPIQPEGMAVRVTLS